MGEDKTGKTRQITLRSTGRALLLIVLSYCALATLGAGFFLSKIERDARLTRDTQIPLILSQTRNAVKIERLSSLVRAVYLTRDRRLERQLQLQVQALTQGFAFDGGQTLVEGSKQVAQLVKDMIKAHQVSSGAGKAANGSQSADLVAYEEAMHILDTMGKEVTGNAALVADDLAIGVQSGAVVVQYLVTAILAIPVVFVVLLLVAARRHLAAPIVAAIEHLEQIGSGHSVEPPARSPALKELSLISDAIVAYGVVAGELRNTNVVLEALAARDALTGLANRRTFDRFLVAAIARAAPNSGTALLLIDIDHFKSINDRFGHPTGDRCLQSLARLLDNISDLPNALAARYGGEEFAIIYDAPSAQHAYEYARFLCKKIEQLETTDTEHGTVKFTASIGVAFALDKNEGNEALVEKADKALYRAKKSGRNRAETDATDGQSRLKDTA